MNPDNELEPIETRLKGLSWWTDPAPKLWKRAMKQAGTSTGKGHSRLHRFLSSRWPWIGTPIAAMIIAAIFVHSESLARRGLLRANLSSLSKGLQSDVSSPALRGPVADQSASPPEVGFTDFDGDLTVQTGVPATVSKSGQWSDGYDFSIARGDGRGYYRINSEGRRVPVAAKQFVAPSARYSSQPVDPPSNAGEDTGRFDRQVIRHAAIDLKTEDVRGVYLKIQTLVPLEAQGEYVEQSQIQGSDKSLEGYITLRVQGDRLGQVLNMLRGLAEVTREQTDASDVTAQVVDVEARLRNERRIEQELIGLLDRRADAPLQDVLKVRESLGSVRERIEQLTGQQATLTKQVALATVLVTIRQKDAPPPPAPTGFAHELGKKLGSAWTGGLDFLATSVAALIQVILGGLVFWIGLIIAVVLLRRWYLRRTEMTNSLR